MSWRVPYAALPSSQPRAHSDDTGAYRQKCAVTLQCLQTGPGGGVPTSPGSGPPPTRDRRRFAFLEARLVHDCGDGGARVASAPSERRELHSDFGRIGLALKMGALHRTPGGGTAHLRKGPPRRGDGRASVLRIALGYELRRGPFLRPLAILTPTNSGARWGAFSTATKPSATSPRTTDASE